MVIAIICILFAAALFLIFHDDHDDSYTRKEKNPGYRQRLPKQEASKQAARPSGTPNPTRFSEARTIVPEEKVYRPGAGPGAGQGAGLGAVPDRDLEKPVLDFHFLDRIDYDATLPERTMSSFIAGIQSRCTEKDLGGLVGWVEINPAGSGLEVHAAPDGRLMGYLPMKDRAAFSTFNPRGVVCPFAGHVGFSVTGKYYADIRIVLPSTRDFVEESLVGFLGWRPAS